MTGEGEKSNVCTCLWRGGKGGPRGTTTLLQAGAALLSPFLAGGMQGEHSAHPGHPLHVGFRWERQCSWYSHATGLKPIEAVSLHFVHIAARRRFFSPFV